MKPVKYLIGKNGILYGEDSNHYLSHKELDEIYKAVSKTRTEYKRLSLSDEVIKSANKKFSEIEQAKSGKNSRILQIFQHWQETFNHPRARLDEKRKKIIQKALINYNVEDLKKCIDGVKNTPWNNGDNPTGTKYDKISLIFRDADQIERFMEAATKKKDDRIISCQFCEWHHQKPSIAPCQRHEPELFMEYQERKNGAKKKENI